MSKLSPLSARFAAGSAEVVARRLLGRWLIRELDGARLVVRIVETEAYLGAPDRASHAWGGRRTPRNESLYLPRGHAYVYFIYGMHYCLNVVTGRAGTGGAVLLRAAAPVAGEARLVELRGLAERAGAGAVSPRLLLGGPGKLCRALGIDRALDGVPLDRPPLWLARGEPVADAEVVVGPRVGVDYAGAAAAWPLRFAIRGHPAVSLPKIPGPS